MNDVRLTLRVPRRVYERLVADAANRSMSVNWFIVDTLEEKFNLPSDTGHRCAFYNWRKLEQPKPHYREC